jgi:hypothetical protein
MDVRNELCYMHLYPVRISSPNNDPLNQWCVRGVCMLAFLFRKVVNLDQPSPGRWIVCSNRALERTRICDYMIAYGTRRDNVML